MNILLRVYTYIYIYIGAPVVFVVIGLGAVHDEYGVRDSGSGNIK